MVISFQPMFVKNKYFLKYIISKSNYVIISKKKYLENCKFELTSDYIISFISYKIFLQNFAH